jgi:hypothetical protein
MDLGNGFLLKPPKRLDEGFKILLEENRVSIETKRQIIHHLKQLGFRTVLKGKGYRYYLTIYQRTLTISPQGR